MPAARHHRAGATPHSAQIVRAHEDRDLYVLARWWASADLAGEAGSVTRGDTMGMVAWLVIGAGIGWLLGRRNSGTSRSETVMAVAIGVVGAILGGLAAVFLVEGQLDLEWQLSGGAGAALGALLLRLWLRPFSR